MRKVTKAHLRLVVQVGEETDPRIFDLPLAASTMPAADRERAVTEAAHAFAQKFNEEVKRAREVHASALVA
jgi:hypothetical protein